MLKLTVLTSALLMLGACAGPPESSNVSRVTEISVAEDADQRRKEGPVVMDKKSADTVCFIVPTPELKARLSDQEWAVLVEAATEPPFMNKYWNNHEPGLYVDAADGTPLFSSATKFDSGTGWPSFWEPIDIDSIVLVEDRSYGMYRIEVRARKSGGHLGHVFDDGPEPTGQRYCINSAALRFIPVAELAEAGYGGYLNPFEQ